MPTHLSHTNISFSKSIQIRVPMRDFANLNPYSQSTAAAELIP